MGDVQVSPVRETTIAVRKPRNAKGLAKLQAKVHTEMFPDIFKEFYAQLATKVKKGDPEALKMVAEIAKLTGKNAGITINNVQNNSNNAVSVGGGRNRRFESIIRQLEARDQEGRISDVDAVDAEFEDVSADSDS
jgi:hypothetical protein